MSTNYTNLVPRAFSSKNGVAGYKSNMLLGHTDTIQKLLNKKEMIIVLENNEITLRSHWDAQIHMEISEKIWGHLSSFSYRGSQRLDIDDSSWLWDPMWEKLNYCIFLFFLGIITTIET